MDTIETLKTKIDDTAAALRQMVLEGDARHAARIRLTRRRVELMHRLDEMGIYYSINTDGALEIDEQACYSMVVRAAAKAFGSTEEAVWGTSRERHVAEARHTAMYLLRELYGKTLSQIAAKFKKDKDSAKYAANNVAVLAETDKAFREKLNQAKKALKPNLNGL